MVHGPSDPQAAERLNEAIFGLRDLDPDMCAAPLLTRRQRRVILAIVVTVVLGLVVSVNITLIGLIAVATAAYVWAVAFRLRLYRFSVTAGGEHVVTAEMARSIPDEELPTYTVLVPAFHEPNLVARLISSVGQLDYPRDRLDIKLLLEADDTATVEAALAAPGVERFEVVLVPSADPRTKPKALNYGLQLARGEFLTIYDAEDRPEPMQLRKAVYALRQADASTACIQAHLEYFNPSQNLITRWFAVEYLMWFSQFLPGLSLVNAPIPLGGTSNHFRTSVLRDLGGWDAFNVTEDADLGVRLHRAGHRVGILSSTTYEEANSDFVNWVRQRSRWYKGYLQTWIVHLRHPRRVWRELGPKGFLRFNLFVGGTPVLALLNPIFWAMTLAWFVGRPHAIITLFPGPVYYTAVSCWLLGNFAFLYMVLLVGLESDQLDLLAAAAGVPIYWVMMSVAAVKALWQLVTEPSYWEKTVHGLDEARTAPADAGV